MIYDVKEKIKWFVKIAGSKIQMVLFFAKTAENI